MIGMHRTYFSLLSGMTWKRLNFSRTKDIEGIGWQRGKCGREREDVRRLVERSKQGDKKERGWSRTRDMLNWGRMK